jgi:hypothetical protein
VKEEMLLKNVFFWSPQGRKRIRRRKRGRPTYECMKNTRKDRALEDGDWEKGLLWKLKSTIREWTLEEGREDN